MLRKARLFLSALTHDWPGLHVLLIVASVLLPLTLFGIIAQQDWVVTLRSAQAEVERGADSVKEHALEVFQTDALVIALIDQRIQSMTWDEIAASPAVHDYLAEVVHENPELAGAFIVDERGVVRSSSRFFPALGSDDISSRDFFLAARESDKLVFGAADEGEILPNGVLDRHFHVARRRRSPNGGFKGVIVLTLSSSYFPKVWLQSWHNSPAAVTDLVTADLRVLAREPRTSIGRIDPAGATAAALRENPNEGSLRSVSSLDNIDRLIAYRRVIPYEAIVVYGVSFASVVHKWEKDILVYGGIFGIASLALTSLAFTAARRLERERVAVARWRNAMQKLTSETEQRHMLEKQLFQAEKLEALGQIAGGFAHDFGNILMAVRLNLEALLGRMANEADEETLRDTLTEIEHGTETVRSLMTFARRRSLDTKIVDPKALIEGIAGLLHQAIGTHSALDISIPREVWPIEVNSNQFELALLNLAVNAHYAMPDGGRLRIAARNLSLAGTPDGLSGDYVEISVSDTGSGMRPEILAKAIEPFFTTREQGKGTGLGLSQVYGFAKQSGGTIVLKSALGEGTTVTMYIPKHLASAVDGATPANQDTTSRDRDSRPASAG